MCGETTENKIKCKCCEDLLQRITSGKAKRLSGGGRHLKHDSMERQLMDWIASEQRSEFLRVSRKMIQKDARIFLASFEMEDSHKSVGWLR